MWEICGSIWVVPFPVLGPGGGYLMKDDTMAVSGTTTSWTVLAGKIGGTSFFI